ncbi:hypothetical protein E2562_011058 [Oryza meyeriana var. granulata]|uniref:Uncharacterized protein n=1 Tax=Oryza meyeriana var. granulata TaxID=110450 RepID=A0A6G1EWG0_9ORYZ|nr:hypothetical protein E2562_011058 [Oryza meyeriana var. granulata]
MAVVETFTGYTIHVATVAKVDTGEREMRDLEDLLSKLNPMVEEFVPPSLAAATPATAPVPAACGYYPNGGWFTLAVLPMATRHRIVVRFPAVDGLGVEE